MKKKQRTKRSTARLTTLDDFLKQTGKLKEFETEAIKEVSAWQIAETKATAASRKVRSPRERTRVTRGQS